MAMRREDTAAAFKLCDQGGGRGKRFRRKRRSQEAKKKKKKKGKKKKKKPTRQDQNQKKPKRLNVNCRRVKAHRAERRFDSVTSQEGHVVREERENLLQDEQIGELKAEKAANR